jgi:hypothetical protein
MYRLFFQTVGQEKIQVARPTFDKITGEEMIKRLNLRNPHIKHWLVYDQNLKEEVEGLTIKRI